MRFRISWVAGLFLFVSNLLSAETVPPLPGPVNLNQDAGCYRWLFITVKSQNGTDLPFIVDTGTPVVVLDKSLAPALGKCLDNTAKIWIQPGFQQSGCYPAPKLFLGDTLLVTGSNVWTLDLSWFSALEGRRIMGILGMDCLSHYCVQLDFKADQMRFLDPAHLDSSNPGQAFPLDLHTTNSAPFFSAPPSIICPGLLGGSNGVVYIDTGDDSDGYAKNDQLKGHHFVRVASFFTTEFMGIPIAVRMKRCVWNGDTYTRLHISSGGFNSLGISFLARHMVTFDFPDRKLYLKQISEGPREEFLSVRLPGEAHDAAQLLLNLDNDGELPGWSRTDHGTVNIAAGPKFGHAVLKDLLGGPAPNSITINFQKRGDSTAYYYTVRRWSDQRPWYLQRAWQADSRGKVLREFPIAFPAFPPSQSR